MYLRIDERSDVLASLTVCLRCVSDEPKEASLWKWAVISLHNALQGAMVCHLSGTAELGALSDKSAKAWLEWYDCEGREGIQPPIQKLATTKELFKRLYSKHKRIESAGAILVIEESQRNSFQKLNKLRDDFTHFTPKGWSIEFCGLPGIFIDMLDVIENISQHPWPFRHMEVDEQRQLQTLLRKLREELEMLV